MKTKTNSAMDDLYELSKQKMQEQRESARESMRRYRNSVKGKASRKRFLESRKGAEYKKREKVRSRK